MAILSLPENLQVPLSHLCKWVIVSKGTRKQSGERGVHHILASESILPLYLDHSRPL